MLRPVAKFGLLTVALMSGLVASGTGIEAQVNPSTTVRPQANPNVTVRPSSDVSIKPRPAPKPVVDVNCLVNPQSRACAASRPRPRPQPQPQPQPSRPGG